MTLDADLEADDRDYSSLRPSDTLAILGNPTWSQLNEPTQYDFFRRAGLHFPWPTVRVVREHPRKSDNV